MIVAVVLVFVQVSRRRFFPTLHLRSKAPPKGKQRSPLQFGLPLTLAVLVVLPWVFRRDLHLVTVPAPTAERSPLDAR